jgi:hypothetical protein
VQGVPTNEVFEETPNEGRIYYFEFNPKDSFVNFGLPDNWTAIFG